jgi:tRNA (guanine37-N1)-methyltransferase
MRIDVVTIFPDMFREVFEYGIVRRAREKGLVDVRVHDLRLFTADRHRTTDDAPYGGGPGMVMKVAPLVEAVESIMTGSPRRSPKGEGMTGSPRRSPKGEGMTGSPRRSPKGEGGGLVLLSPRGTPLDQTKVTELSREDHLVLVAGRYEGVDERFLELTGAEEISIGDYVLSGGEIPAMVVVDAVVRLLPGAISDPRSAAEDSFSRGVLDYPHYTRPAEYRGLRVPEVLLSGDHGAVAAWRESRALSDTRARRPELLRERS